MRMTLLILLSTACGGDGQADAELPSEGPIDTDAPAPTPGTDDSPQQLCVDIINTHRTTLSLPALRRWTGGEACSDGEAESDSISGVAHGAFGDCGEWAQNECPGWPSPVESMLDGCLQMMWDEGPGADFSLHGHYINMSSTQYTEVACGFHTTPGGSIWSVQNFR